MALENIAKDGCDGRNALAIDEGITILCRNGHDCSHVLEFKRPVHYQGKVYVVCNSPEVRKAYEKGKIKVSQVEETVPEAMVSGAEVSRAYGKGKGLFG